MSRLATARTLAGLLLIAMQTRAAVTVATVGDSLADSIYLGLKLQPDLLRKSGINLVRWSRPKIGLTRTDYFDYTGWLRDSTEIGTADFCVVEMGANDLQSIWTGEQKWLRVGTDGWQRMYTDRVLAMVKLLKSKRCASVVWLLQPSYQNKYLSQYHEMINAVQLEGSSANAAVFEIVARAEDYGPDGIHPNKDFSFKLGRAVAALASAWQPFSGTNCASCHALPGLFQPRLPDVKPLIPRQLSGARLSALPFAN
jgi:lysophospholipase L1-like esterase